MTTTPAVRRDTADQITLLRMDRGANALNTTLIAELADHLSELQRCGAPGLVLASTHPGVFCPGLDLKALDGGSRALVRDLIGSFNSILRLLVAYPGPTVAAVAGHAVAGGCLLALACDRRVMARAGARMGLSEINLGLPVPAGAVAMMLALYQTRAVEQLVLEGDGLGGERAMEVGLVEQLADGAGVEAEAIRLAGQLASRPRPALVTAKEYLRHGLIETMIRRDEEETERFLDHWFLPETQDRLAAVILAMSRGQG